MVGRETRAVGAWCTIGLAAVIAERGDAVGCPSAGVIVVCAVDVGGWCEITGRGVVPLYVPGEASDSSVSRLNARSRADWKRCSRSFSRQRRTRRSSGGGTAGLNCETSGGSSFRIALSVSIPELRLNARWPLRIS